MTFKSILKILTLASLVSLPNVSKAENFAYFTKDPTSKNLELGLFLPSEEGTGPHLSLRLENSLPGLAKVLYGLGFGAERRFKHLSLGGKAQGYFSGGGEYDTDGDGEMDSNGGFGLMGLVQGYATKRLPWKGLEVTLAYSLKKPTMLNDPTDSEIFSNTSQLELGVRKSF